MSDQEFLDVAELQRQGVLLVEDGNHGENRPRRDEFSDSGVAFIRAADLHDGRVRFEAASKINDVAVARIRKGVGRPGDVLLSHKGTVGKVALVTADGPEFVCSPQTTFYRSLDPDRLDPRYLFFYLHSPEFTRQLRARENETDMAAYVSLTEQRRLRLRVPAIRTQRAIVEVLGALEDKIDANRRLIHTSSELGAAMFRQAASGRVALSTVAELTMGQSPPGDTYNSSGVGLPFYQGTRDFGFRHPSVRVWCSEPTRRAQPGDLLISVRAPVGSLNVAVEECAIGRGIAAVRSDFNHTLYQALKAEPAIWTPYESEGTVFGSINKQQLLSVQLPWVPSIELNRLESRLATLDDCLTGATRESALVAHLRDSLLAPLMSGEVRVREAEAQLGEAL